MESKKSKFPYLPDDVIIEILLRSPLKSIGRFRCLSKLFCFLLSNPKFAREQLELTLRRTNVVRLNNRRLIASSPKLILIDLDSIDVEREYNLKEDLIMLSNFKKRKSFLSDPGITGCDIRIIGSSNGLVCVRCERDITDEVILLYNPTTRDSKIIPELPESLHLEPDHESFAYGFDFDALTNDYKVVKLVCCKDDELQIQSTICYVYSLKTDSWRRINNLLPPYYLPYVNCSSANFKGAIHWITRNEGFQKVLIAFDLEKEELREMSLPNCHDNHWCKFAVDTLKGCLCVVHVCDEMPNIIWVMNEYGLESSWSKIIINVSEYSIKPTLYLNEKVPLVLDGHFVYTKVNDICFFKINTSMYVESLISPNSYGEQMNKGLVSSFM